MIDKALETIEKYALLKSGNSVVIGVSGGADSMALTYFLYSIKNEYNLNLIIAHINHMIRGEEADEDEKFVKNEAQKLCLDFRLFRADIPKISAKSGESEEECGRRIRYEFFKSVDENAVIATAHTLSDSMETVLLNLARGTGLKGICAIPVKRDNIIRPLIFCTRREIEEYCSANNINYRLDSTNSKDIYKRNAVRSKIIPALYELNPSFDSSFLRFISNINQDEALLEDLTDKALESTRVQGGYSVKELKNLPESVKSRALAYILKENTGITHEAKHINAVSRLLEKGGSVQVLRDITVRVRKGILEFPDYSDTLESWECDFDLDEITLPVGRAKKLIIYKKDNFSSKKIQKDLLDIFLDCDKIKGNLKIRSRQEGDKFSPSYMTGSVTLKKLFNSRGVPPEKRNAVPIICDDNGIAAVGALGVDKRVCVTEQTERILNIKIFSNDKGRLGNERRY